MNRLQFETSPYLLQHAGNPVDWYAWGEEALQKAKAEDKPIIVSIGYSACHWCHVMEHESFENEQIAALMNEKFICVKVDREERPDIDAIYMDAVQAMGLRGGWPLNVFLNPDGKPFYGGTYFQSRQWMGLLGQIAEAYVKHRSELDKSADGFSQNMQTMESEKYGLVAETKTFHQDDLHQMFAKLSAQFDTEWGGMNRAPKFPMPSNWFFLLRYYSVTQRTEALTQVVRTLDKMALGGIYDQLGGGFARYSTDGEWFLPHFEKMLYDNAQLLGLYAEAYLQTRHPLYREVLIQTAEFVREWMTGPEGGFYSAYDADSEGVEGKFYVWTHAEVQQLLGGQAEWFCAYYGITEAGTFLDEATHQPTGTNILFPQRRFESFCAERGFNTAIYTPLLAQCKQQLLQARAKRIMPGLDDKVLTSWNALMIKGLLAAYVATEQPSLLALAKKNAHFVRSKLTHGNQLWHSYKNGKAKIMGFLEDYAAVIDAYISLYEITFEEEWLAFAESHTLYVWEHFWDANDELFYFTDQQAERLIARKKEVFDNVVPSSNSMMANNLYRLGYLLSRKDFVNTAKHLVAKVKRLLLVNADYLSNWAIAAVSMATPFAEVVIVGPDYQEVAKQIRRQYLPNKVMLGAAAKSTLPLFAGRSSTGTDTLIYVCIDQTCQLPLRTAQEAISMLESLK